MAKTDGDKKEMIELSFNEMDICFQAVGTIIKKAESVFNSADKLGMKKAAETITEFRTRLTELQNKFLH